MNSKTKSILKSIGAVITGILINVIPAITIDAVLHVTNCYPPMGERMSDSLFLLAISYRLALAILGGFFTAKLSPYSPIGHVITLGVIGTIASTLGHIQMGDQGPAWYSIGLIVISIPLSWLGGFIYLKRKG
ncbi:hypothetical protein CH352_10970 [Leptospira hartskeerlii]|uniref:Uncharacterized protein n=1 Tax=Leptospira hartskeerlii TaxID=2023177 RepID=A0A2M9XBZ9_9LEPT|nr:hypothetical protein [Leptospira hartskeerlii]PJZ25082.1 hypothetical protein CH357_12775 [Leptospira hartskeerlii]PJZ33475.1 hypothetical protein CH352_10970 [Leptospira hartskeerlii]